MLGLFRSYCAFPFRLKWLLILLALLFFREKVSGQTFTSNQDGNWSNSSIWTRTNPNGCGNLNTYPQTSTYWPDCQVDVYVDHNVNFDLSTSFGGGYFKSLTVSGPLGKLTFSGDLKFDVNGSSLPDPKNVVINVTNGGYLDVTNGSLLVNRAGVLNISGNSTVVVRDLVLESNSAVVNVEEGSKLIVINSATIHSSTTLNLKGDLITKSLKFDSGGILNATNNSAINVGEMFTLGNGTLDMADEADISVGGDMVMSGGGLLRMSGNTTATVTGILDINSTNPVQMSDYATFIVDGIRDGDIGSFSILDYSCYQSATDANNCAVVLPVSWEYVNASYISSDHQIEIIWKVSGIENIASYEVYRSIGGVDSFELMGSVLPDVNGSHAFVDDQLSFSGERLYYRVKQIGEKGGSSFSKTVAVDVPATMNSKNTWRAYPNPAKGNPVKLSLVNAGKFEDGLIELTAYNSLIQANVLTATSIDELNVKVNQLLSGFGSGLVILEVKWQNKVERIKLLL
ncbi:hypothetical protein IFO69_07170 [Echinicola sp. CAU 1574]|uniref:Uncharacterized protein n=1 Tax=Echinicola arenosa TaxID=2774144 RepID=A0ABR9AI49_9BACT|nr:hypothetical protein [Echinicola arenosa]MBD8488517.1 hypothetical protein [Echinicola arenosa]